MARLEDLLFTAAANCLCRPCLAFAIEGELVEAAVHENAAAKLFDFDRRGLPHHAGAPARIAERFDESLSPFSAPGSKPKRALATVKDRFRKIEALDSLRRPIGRDLVAIHAPDFLGIGFEKDREEPLAEFIAHPLMECLRVLDGQRAGIGIEGKACQALCEPEIAQRFEGLQGIGVELAIVVYA